MSVVVTTAAHGMAGHRRSPRCCFQAGKMPRGRRRGTDGPLTWPGKVRAPVKLVHAGMHVHRTSSIPGKTIRRERVVPGSVGSAARRGDRDEAGIARGRGRAVRPDHARLGFQPQHEDFRQHCRAP